MKKGVMMQYFHWDLKDDGNLWNKLYDDIPNLSKSGITALWLPPAYKGNGGKSDVGYGVYDLYDLGEFNQKGTIKTKYGSKDEYLRAIKKAHEYHIDVYADMVFNHKMGADNTQDVLAYQTDSNNRNVVISDLEKIKAWTVFNFEARNNKYSDFKWNSSHFTGVDFDDHLKKKAIYRFNDESWSKDVSLENGNYDYLMGADVDFNNQEVIDELYRYGKWYLDFTEVDGFRLDALKHIDNDFFKNFLDYERKVSNKELFTVGEYWSNDINELLNYLNKNENKLSLFDVPLHYHFFEISNGNGYFDMGKIFHDTLVLNRPTNAVTFVENHDTQIGQALQTVVSDWFKTMAYALILLRNEGYPCIFYGDYYGIEKYQTKAFKEDIDLLINIRQTKMTGINHDYFDDANIIGWTFEGLKDDEGFAILINDNVSGEKVMHMGNKNANRLMYNIKANHEVILDNNGYGKFSVEGGNYSLYIFK